jgi:transposase
LLRGGPDWLRLVLAADGARFRVRSNRAVLAPSKPGDRVKTDRRDAERLARSYQSGDLTAVWVPDSRHEALRDLVRLHAAAKEDEKRAKHRLGKYLLRYAQRPSGECRAWSAAWWQWVRKLQLAHAEQNAALLELIVEVDHQDGRVGRIERLIEDAVAQAPERLRVVIEALQSLHGVARETATIVAVELGSFERFERASQPRRWRRSTASCSPEVARVPRHRVHERHRRGSVRWRRAAVLPRHEARFALFFEPAEPLRGVGPDTYCQ